MTGSFQGVLPVDKPVGPTSHDVVSVARRSLGERRIGHTGTLDPFASGLMLLCVGTATRVAEFLTGMDKSYEATAVLGVTTDSGDRDGTVVATSDGWRSLDSETVDRALDAFRGTFDQLPPALSAKKVGGVPAHRRVRRGETVALAPKAVTVHTLEVVEVALPMVRLRLRCSTGTYVRSVARDLGEALGVGAHLTALRRTGVGDFSVDGALSLDDLSDRAKVDGVRIPVLDALGHLPRLAVTAQAETDLGHGRSVDAPDMPDTETVAAAAGSRLVAVGAVREGRFRPRKVFHGA